MITVACLTSLVALNGKNHAGTGNSAAFTVTQPLERAQNDAFGHPMNLRQLRCTPEASNVHVFNKVSFILVLAKVSTQQVRSPYGISVYVVSMSVSYHIILYLSISYNIISKSSYINQYHIIVAYVMAAA